MVLLSAFSIITRRLRYQAYCGGVIVTRQRLRRQSSQKRKGDQRDHPLIAYAIGNQLTLPENPLEHTKGSF